MKKKLWNISLKKNKIEKNVEKDRNKINWIKTIEKKTKISI